MFVVPEVLEVHVVPSYEERMVPELPTTTKVLFPSFTPQRSSVVLEVLEVDVVPSSYVASLVTPLPTATKDLFA